MARRLTDKPNKIILHDNISDTEIEFTYRMPTTDERTKFSNMAVKKKRNKIDFQTMQARQKYGMKILVGIREGDFEIEKGKKFVTIASDQTSPNYDENWKKHIEDHAIDLVMLLAAHAFEGSAEIGNDEVDDQD